MDRKEGMFSQPQSGAVVGQWRGSGGAVEEVTALTTVPFALLLIVWKSGVPGIATPAMPSHHEKRDILSKMGKVRL